MSEFTAEERANLRLRILLRGSLATAGELRVTERDLLLALAGFAAQVPGTVAKIRAALAPVLAG